MTSKPATRDKSPIRGFKVSPSDWTRYELLEKVAKFSLIEVNESKIKLEMNGKKLFGDIMLTLRELFHRFAEIELILLRNCFITDELFIEIVDLIKESQSLENFHVPFNYLTQKSVLAFIDAFSGKYLSINLRSIDMRDNQLTADDSIQLYHAFQNIQKLNGISIWAIRRNREIDSIQLSNSQLKLAEISVLQQLITEARHIKRLDLSRNLLDASCTKIIGSIVQNCPNITSIDISNNNLISTEEGTDLEGLNMILSGLKSSKTLLHLNITGCKVPSFYIEHFECSTQVNRRLHARKTSSNPFRDYIQQEAKARAEPLPTDHFLKWTPKLVVDKNFSNREEKRRPNSRVEVIGDSIVLPAYVRSGNHKTLYSWAEKRRSRLSSIPQLEHVSK